MFKGFIKKNITIENYEYKIFLKKQIVLAKEYPRLIIVSYLPVKETIKLIKISISTIKKYTTIPYELWVIDNNSPIKNLKWLLRQKGINLVLNRKTPKPPDDKFRESYSNGIALEIARQLVDPETKYFMTLHQDIAVCNNSWLEFLLSKFNDKTKAVGVRLDRKRVTDGVLHVLGYIVDLQIILKNKLSFIPHLPEYDVGDKLIVDLKNMGYEIHASPNTLWEPELVEKIDNNSPLKTLKADRSFNDEGNIFFLHLGRGVLKSQKDSNYFNKTIIEVWYKIIKRYYL